MHILIFQEGKFDGFKFCLESIARHSPSSQVHVLTRESVKDPVIDSILKNYEHHHANNPKSFVLRSIIRWAVMLYYAKAHGIESFFTCDSDVLIFTDVSLHTFDTPMFGWTGTAFVMKLEPLEGFVEWLDRMYREKGELLAKQIQVGHDFNEGGVCDMALFQGYFSERPGLLRRGGLSLDGIFDSNICLAEGFEMDGDRKRLVFRGGVPYTVKKDGEPFIKLHSLHCWGAYKHKMSALWYAANSSLLT